MYSASLDISHTVVNLSASDVNPPVFLKYYLHVNKYDIQLLKIYQTVKSIKSFGGV